MKKLLSLVLALTVLLGVTAGINSTAFAKTSAPSVTKLKAKENAFTVVLTKTKKTDGFQIKCATDKKFKKNVKVITTVKANKTVKKLKGGKTYYVKVRSYKTANGKKKYSKWSAVKKVKTKISVKQMLINGYLYLPWAQDTGLYETTFNKDGTYVTYDYVPVYKNGKKTKKWEKWYFEETKQYAIKKGTYTVNGNSVTLSYYDDILYTTRTESFYYDAKHKYFRSYNWADETTGFEDYFCKYTYRKTKMKTSEMDEFFKIHNPTDTYIKA